MTLDRYIMRLLLVRTVFAVVVLIGLVQVLELLDVSTEILQRGLGLEGIGRYSLLRLPSQFQQIAALGVLVGSLFTFTQLARTSEMVVIRATGANIYRVLRMMAPVAIGVALVDFVIAAEVAPRTEDALAHWMAVHAPPLQGQAGQAALVSAGNRPGDGRRGFRGRPHAAQSANLSTRPRQDPDRRDRGPCVHVRAGRLAHAQRSDHARDGGPIDRQPPR